MENDSVREELKPQVSARLTPVNIEMKENSSASDKPTPQISFAKSSDSTGIRQQTSEIAIKQTSPTLVDFNHKNATLPEWRLKLQNAVRQRQGYIAAKVEMPVQPVVRQTHLATSGANALKAAVIAEPVPVVKTAIVPVINHENKTLNSALRRIEKSRQQFLEPEQPEVPAAVPPQAARKNYPFHIAAKQNEVPFKPVSASATVNPPVKPKLAPSLRLDSEPLNTNKLPPLPEAVKSSPGFAQRLITSLVGEIKTEEKKEVIKPVITAKEIIKPLETLEVSEPEIEEADDCAPFAMRFNAGLFDLIIGSFATLLLLSPFILTGENWLSFGGFFTFLVICGFVMFGYMTVAVGYFGKTLGMRLFSLELVDIEGESYPTMHQAAVSSAIYLLSLVFGGIGFLTMLFNDDKRAAHDLISKTIVVRES